MSIENVNDLPELRAHILRVECSRPGIPAKHAHQCAKIGLPYPKIGKAVKQGARALVTDRAGKEFRCVHAGKRAPQALGIALNACGNSIE
jgi:hypothetical protein